MDQKAVDRGQPGSPLVIAALLAMGVVLGLLMGIGAPVTHSVVPNLLWPAQFSALLQSGVAYPRWLPDAFAGLGSPTFVFYAPLPFYLLAVIDTVTAGWLDPYRLVGTGSAVMLACSGVTMWYWLRHRTTPRRAVLGGIAYACAPYHLFDAFVRGSLGELAAYAILPLLIAALEATLDRRPGAVPSLALCCAALLVSHLPSALFIGGLLVPARILWFAAQRRGSARPLLGAALGGALGLGLAAVYVFPALGLLDMARMDYFAGGHYDARRWLLLFPSSWDDRGAYGFVLSLTLSLVALALVGMRATRAPGGRDDAAFWPMVILAVAVLISGLVPWIWEPASPFSRIEFPWRMLLVAEFAAICVAVDVVGRWQGAKRRIAIVVPVFLAAPALGLLLGSAASSYDMLFPASPWRRIEAEVFRIMPDAIEYLPAGHPVAFGSRSAPSWPEILGLAEAGRGQGGVWLDPPAGQVSIHPSGPRGEATIEVQAASPVTVVLRRFAFPLWRVLPEGGGVTVDVAPYGADRLLSFPVPAGETHWRLVWSPPLPMRLGAIVSVVSALIVLVLGAIAAWSVGVWRRIMGGG